MSVLAKEAITRRPHVRFDVHEITQIGEVRRQAVQWGAELGFDDVTCGRVALVATELGTNLVRHAKQGQMLIGSVRDAHGLPALELIATDHGPGVSDWARCLADGYSTGGTSGTGLGAVRRLACVFDAYSAVPAGTVILTRICQPAQAANEPITSRFDVGAIAVAAPGERECGDAFAYDIQGDQAAVCLIDGLGHGHDAAEAAQAGVDVFQMAPLQAPVLLMDRMHEAMRKTRGGAALLAQLSFVNNEIQYCGMGNVAGRIVSGAEDRSLLSQHGTVGVQIRRPTETRIAWPAHAMLVMHSDGLATRWNLEGAPGLIQHHPSLVAAWLLRDHARGRDDVTVVVIKRRLS